MFFYNPITIIFSIFASLIIYAVWFTATHDQLRKVPGPLLARFSDIWLTLQARLGRRYLSVHAAHLKYGPVVRIAPNHVSIASKEAISVVFGQGSKALPKSPFYDAFIGGTTSVFSTRDRAEHSKKRRNFSNTFAAQTVKDYLPLIHDRLDELLNQFDYYCNYNNRIQESSSRGIDILQWFNYFTFDVLSDLAFGRPLGMLKKGSDIIHLPGSNAQMEHGCISIVDHREHLAVVVGLNPMLRSMANWIPDPFFHKGKDCTDALVEVARACVTDRLNRPVERDDILGKILASRGELSQISQQDREELISEAVTLLIAGSDTTSNSMTAILYLLIKHPRVHKKLLRELESAFGYGNLPKTSEDCNQVSYLQDVINESLRIFSPTAIGLPRSVPPEGIYFSGYYFPGGTELSVPSWTIQHDPTIWGADVDEFRPERWSENPGIGKYLMTFGFGPRACLGRNLAYLEMKMVIATLTLRYEFTLHTDRLETTEGFMHKPRELVVQVRRREVDI